LFKKSEFVPEVHSLGYCLENNSRS